MSLETVTVTHWVVRGPKVFGFGITDKGKKVFIPGSTRRLVCVRNGKPSLDPYHIDPRKGVGPQATLKAVIASPRKANNLPFCAAWATASDWENAVALARRLPGLEVLIGVYPSGEEVEVKVLEGGGGLLWQGDAELVKDLRDQGFVSAFCRVYTPTYEVHDYNRVEL